MYEQFLRLNLAAAFVEKAEPINEEFLSAIILILATGLYRLRQGTWRGESAGRGTPAWSRHERRARRPATRIPDQAQVTGAVTGQHGASRPWTDLSTKWSLTQLHWLLHFTDEKPEVKKERLIEWPCAPELQAEETVVGGACPQGLPHPRSSRSRVSPPPAFQGEKQEQPCP